MKRARILSAGVFVAAAGCGAGEDPAPAPPAQEQGGAAAAAPAIPAAPGRQLDAGRSLTGTVSGLSGAASDLGARVTATEIIVDLPADVLFEFDQAEIQTAAVPTLRTLAELIEENPTGLVTINGHTDSVGSDAYNQSLSEERAQSVAAWLTRSGGVSPDRLRTAGSGKSRPLAPNERPDGSDDPDGRARNRRVEVILPRG